MKNVSISLFVLYIFLLIGCSTSTKITAAWTDKEYEKGKIRSIMVMGIAKREAVRRIFEEDMVERFEYIGVTCLASSQIFPKDVKLDTNTYRLHFSNSGIDAVLTSKLVSADKSQTYVQGSSYYGGYPRHGGFYGYYGSSYDYMYSPGYTITSTTLKIETNLYDTKTEQLIWTAISDTFDPTNETDAIKSLNKKLVDELYKAGFFYKKEK